MAGWINLDNGTYDVDLICKFGNYGTNQTNKMDIEQYAGDGRYKSDLYERIREYVIQNAYVTSHADLVKLLQILDGDDNITLTVDRNASGDKMPIYSDETTMTVACIVYTRPYQLDHAGTRFKINRILLKQSK